MQIGRSFGKLCISGDSFVLAAPTSVDVDSFLNWGPFEGPFL